MNRGYLKLWRRSLDTEVFHNPELWRLWTWCLMKTSRKKRFAPFVTGKGKLSISIAPGQFLFGRNRAADFLGDSPSTVWKRMKKLETIGNIKIESNRQYSIVTICNWLEYQEPEPQKVTGKEQASDKQVTTEEQLSDTDNKVLNVVKEVTTKQKNGKRFSPPSYEDVANYCSERKNTVDPERFLDYYTSNGWMVSKNKMKCWKSAVRTWEKNNFSTQNGSRQEKPKTKRQIEALQLLESL